MAFTLQFCHSGEPRIGVRGRRRNLVFTNTSWIPGQARNDGGRIFQRSQNYA